LQPRKRAVVAVGLAAAAALALTGLALAGRTSMPVHTGAKITILAPKPGQVITGNTVHTKLRISHFKLSCARAGTAPKMGVGHYHVLLDGALVNMFCGRRASISLANVASGTHTLEFVAAENNHMEDMHTAKKVSFVYQPTQPQVIGPRQFPGAPSISIVSPKRGATVSGGFNLLVKWKNIVPSCALYGKPDVAGYGHWHAFVDTTMGAPMGMGTMLGMSCAHRFHVSLQGIKPGKHKFFAEIEDNAHTPSIKGHTTAVVTVNVK